MSVGPPGYGSDVEWVAVYDLRNDETFVRDVQHATIHTPDYGLDPYPALFGSAEWWERVDDGSVPSRTRDGIIADVRWGSMGDHPEWIFRTADGHDSTWARKGDHTRYVTGLRARVTTATVRWKPGAPSVRQLGEQPDHDILIRVDLQPSDERSAPRGPGPFSGAYDDLRQQPAD